MKKTLLEEGRHRIPSDVPKGGRTQWRPGGCEALSC